MALIENTLFGVVDKVKESIDIIKKFDGCDPQGYYVAFSGGKDSCVILDLVKRAGVKFDAHYNLTTVDPPELVRFIMDKHPEVQIDRPKKTMWELIEHKGFPPQRAVRYCCEALKERGGEGRFVITGIRREESPNRSFRGVFEECETKGGKKLLHPIISWTEKDVWQYIREHNLPYCELYDQGFKRLGCVMCPMAGSNQMKKEAARWPRIAMAYVRAFDRAIQKRRELGKKIDQQTGLAMYNWWINKEGKEPEGQGQFSYE